MKNFGQRITELSTEKREFLERLLQKEGVQYPSGLVDRPVIQPVPRDAELPLSFAQQRLWFMDQLVPSCDFYTIPAALRLQGVLHTSALERSLSELVRRHEALRTVFKSEQGKAVQVIRDAQPVDVPMIDLSDLPDTQRETEAQRLATEEAARPFDLADGPLIRAQLLRLAERDHVLLLTMHHIVSDGWSLGVLFKELGTLYEAFAKAKPSPLPELPIQYADFAVWQRQWLRGDVLTKQMDYWQQQLADVSTLPLPTDRPRPPAQTYRAGSETVVLSKSLSEQLESLSQREGVTLFMTLLAAFAALLHRYTGQEDIVVGSPIANRNHSQIESLIGFFVNTLVMRTDVSGDPTIGQLVGRVREVALGAYAHQDLPFEKLVEELDPGRDLSRNPLFQVGFAVQNVPLGRLDLEGLTVSTVSVERRQTHFDVDLHVWEAESGLRLSLTYNTDLFEARSMARLLEHYERLLGGAVTSPDAPLSAVSLLSEDECAQLESWNATAREYVEPHRLQDLIGLQVARTPDAPAVIYEESSLTYTELEAKALALALELRRLGVSRDVLVGVCMERSLELPVALYAVLKAGGAYVPMDPEYPRERLAFMMDDAKAPVLLTQSHLLSSLPAHTGRIICMDTKLERLQLRGASSVADEAGVEPDDLAYVIYTSGSTGKPKGAMVTNRAICNRLLWMQEAFGLSPDDRVLQKTPFSFDVSVWEFFWPLMTGACLVMACPGGHRDGGYLVNVIREQRITTLHFVPSMLRVFLQEADVGECSSVKRVICSGEALGKDLQDQFFACISAELHNLYGPTEAAVDVTHWQCREDDGGEVVPIGRPIANTQIYVLDKGMRPVPMGVAGELHIGGVQVARGYLNREELTAERFVPNLFGDGSGRLYKTGDLARYRSDGCIEYLGRMDDQVKVRGMRVELGEVESVLGEHAGVRQAVVLCVEETPGDPRLVAYVVGSPEAAVGASELRAYLRERLPGYMVPSAFVVLEALPLTPNGKLDRRALPAPEVAHTSLGREYVAPRGGVQERVAQIWREVLRVEQVGMHDEFFDLGGHSLLATQVVSRIREAFDIELPVMSVFESQTLERLAERVEEVSWAVHGRDTVSEQNSAQVQEGSL